MRNTILCLLLIGCGQPLVGASNPLLGTYHGTTNTVVTDCDTGALLGNTNMDSTITIESDSMNLFFNDHCRVMLDQDDDMHAFVVTGPCVNAPGDVMGGHVEIATNRLTAEYTVQASSAASCVDAVITIHATK